MSEPQSQRRWQASLAESFTCRDVRMADEDLVRRIATIFQIPEETLTGGHQAVRIDAHISDQTLDVIAGVHRDISIGQGAEACMEPVAEVPTLDTMQRAAALILEGQPATAPHALENFQLDTTHVRPIVEGPEFISQNVTVHGTNQFGDPVTEQVNVHVHPRAPIHGDYGPSANAIDNVRLVEWSVESRPLPGYRIAHVGNMEIRDVPTDPIHEPHLINYYQTLQNRYIRAWIGVCHSCEQVSIAQIPDHQVYVLPHTIEETYEEDRGGHVTLTRRWQTAWRIRCDWCRHIDRLLQNAEFVRLIREDIWESREGLLAWNPSYLHRMRFIDPTDYRIPVSRFGHIMLAHCSESGHFTIADENWSDAQECLRRLEAWPQSLRQKVSWEGEDRQGAVSRYGREFL